LTGGGLIRSDGGWHAVKEAYRDGIRISGDERILGGSDFVETTLKHSGEVYGRRLRSAILPLGSCRSREAKSLFDAISTAPPSAGQRTGSAMMRTSPQPSRPSLRCSCRLQVNNETMSPCYSQFAAGSDGSTFNIGAQIASSDLTTHCKGSL
jgi:hypothetical protein